MTEEPRCFSPVAAGFSNYNGEYITVNAQSEEKAKILAQAEAIKRGWDYEILPNTMSTKELKELISNKVDEIFNAYEERTNTCKDIKTFDVIALDMIEDTLATLIVANCK